MSDKTVALLRIIRSAGYVSEAHLIAMAGGECTEASTRRALERFKREGLVQWGPTLGYWITAKGEAAATGHFAVTVLKA